jgi:hypothetical protein
MRRRILCTVLPVIACACGGARAELTGPVTSMAVRVESTADGSIRVRETYDLSPAASGAIRFGRRLPADHSDGVVFESFTVDGTPIAPGEQGLTVVAKSNSLDLTWLPTTPASSPRRVSLVMRAVSAIAVTQPRASLSWPVLSAGRDQDLQRVDIELVLPVGTTIYPGTGIAEANWNVAVTPVGITSHKSPVAQSESATLVAAFDFDRRGVPDPVWERNLDRQRQFLPAFLAGALFFLVVGVGTLVILRAQYPSKARLARQPQAALPPVADRDSAAAGLRLTGVIGLLIAAGSAAVAATTLGFLGLAVQAIPATMALVSAVFVVYAPRLRQ